MVMQGLHQGTQASMENGQRQQQMVMLAHQLGQEQAGRNALLAQMDQLNPAPQPTVDLYGQGAGSDTDMGPPSQQPNPQVDQWQQTRNAMAMAPLSVVQHYANGYQETAQKQRDQQQQIDIANKEQERKLAFLKSAAENTHIGHQYGNSYLSPQVQAYEHELGIGGPAPTSPDEVYGLQNNDPNAISQYGNSGHPISQFLPNRMTPGQVSADQMERLNSTDPTTREGAQAEVMNLLHAKNINAVIPRATGRTPPAPADADAQTQALVDQLQSGGKTVPPSTVAQMHYYIARGERIPDAVFGRGEAPDKNGQKAMQIHQKQRLDSAQMDVRARQSQVNDALKLAAGDAVQAQKTNPQAFGALNAAKAYRNSILDEGIDSPSDPATPSGTTNSRSNPSPAPISPAAQGAPAMTKQDAIKRALAEPGSDKLTDEQLRQRAMQILNGGGQ